MVDSHSRLIDTMIPVSAFDANGSDEERDTIGEPVCYLPVLRDFEHSRLAERTKACLALLTDPDGLDRSPAKDQRHRADSVPRRACHMTL